MRIAGIDFLGFFWSRAYNTQLTLQNVPQHWNLVQRQIANEPSDARVLVWRFTRRAFHPAKAMKEKRLPILADSFGVVENRTTYLQLYCQCDNQSQRRKNDTQNNGKSTQRLVRTF